MIEGKDAMDEVGLDPLKWMNWADEVMCIKLKNMAMEDFVQGHQARKLEMMSHMGIKLKCKERMLCRMDLSMPHEDIL